MTFEEFIHLLIITFPIGTVLNNPGGGISIITSLTNERISYRRGQSIISVRIIDLYEAFQHFLGMEVSSRDLRQFMPSVFDSSARPAGHSCNCTFFFRVLENLNLCGPIYGDGVRGDPYTVTIFENGG